MEGMPSAHEYLTVSSCYIKEELDLSNVTDYSDDEPMYRYYVEPPISSTMNNKIASIASLNTGINVHKTNVKDEHSAGLENSKNSDKSEDVMAEKNSSNNRVAIMGEESEDTDVDVENDSSDDETNNISFRQENSNAMEEDAWEHDSSEEDFELKMSDDSQGDRLKLTEADDLNDDSKSECAANSNELNSTKVESRSYVTRNRSKNLTPTPQSTNINSDKSSALKQSKSEAKDEKMTTRNSLKRLDTTVMEQKKIRIRRRIEKKDAVVNFCPKCRIILKMKTCSTTVKCSKCKKTMKYKCLLCKNKDHITDTYCGAAKHVSLHHAFKKKASDHYKMRSSSRMSSQKSTVNESETVNTQVNSPTSTISSPKVKVNPQKTVVKRDLVLADIEKFTILICLKCNEVARVYNGKISECGGCKVKMILTCLICSQYENTIYGMYQHLHDKHKEHCTEEQQDNSNKLTNVESDKSEKKPRIVRNKRCLKCKRRFLSTSTAYKHAESCTGIGNFHWKCDYCTYQTNFKSALKRHHSRKHKATIVNNVNKSGVISKNLVKKKSISQNKKPKNQCPVCGKTCKSIDSQKRHEMYCGVAPHLKCQYCPYMTKYKSNLTSHTNQIHAGKIESEIVKQNEAKETSATLDAPKAPKETGKSKPNTSSNGNSSSVPLVKPLHEVAEVVCPKCNENKDMVQNFKERHCEKCNTILLYRCMVCSKTYEFYQSLMYHMNSSCNPSASYECLKCDYKTSVLNCIQKHIRTHGINPWDLTSAGKRGKGVSMEIEEDNKIFKIIKYKEYQSEIVPQGRNGKITTEESANEKIKPKISIQQSTMKSECPKCKIFVLHLKKHLIFCGLEATSKCKLCPYKTKYGYNLKAHMRKVHHTYCKSKITKRKPNDCDKKEEIINNIDSDIPKVNNIDSDVPKVVKKCNAPQLKAEDLMQSYCIKCNTSKEALKYAFKCRVCESQLTYRCVKCNEKYPTRDELRVHVRLHWHKPFACPKCSKTFGHAENLLMHEKICTGTVTTISVENNP
ncbi:zinc finger protein 808 isoform X2 [Copidosoma floridanum]|uniref:zinc finger protein 808 isoform X2 n=1 Tax=Copidosoma floridanum TaxID=29053 RepID=UPI0006C9A87C|nr:zinc finger protein 808 isoform X2 [Copidosoma floridanum]